MESKKTKVKKKQAAKKDRYFDFYDDIKDKTHRVVDW